VKDITSYLSGWPEYLFRTFHRIDLVCGGVIAVLYFFFAGYLPLDNHRGLVTGAIIVAAFVEAGYGVYREERTTRSEREKKFWVEARIIGFSANEPDPGPTKTSIGVKVLCEIWTSIDVTSDALGLNILWGYRNHWWELWRKDRVAKEGLPPVGEQTTRFRKSLRAADPQPIRWQLDFQYVADRFTADDPHWFLELVIKTECRPIRAASRFLWKVRSGRT